MSGLAKYLTKANYRNILFTIGRSERPLSGVEIEKKTGLSHYVYDMLKELAPSEFNTEVRLFGWEEILQKKNDGKYKGELIKKFNRTFGLDWEIDEKDSESANIRNNELIALDKIDENTIVIEHTEAEQIIAIELPKERMMLDDVHVSTRSIKGDELELRKKYSGITLKNDREGKLAIYTLKEDPYASAKTRFLDVTLSKEAENKLSEIKQREEQKAGCVISEFDLREFCPEYKAIRINKKNWRYSLTFYGFLLYLACEYETKSKERRGRKDRRDRKDVRRIYRVISNQAVLNHAPFLWHWEDFKNNVNGFKVDEILMEIGNEFKNQLDYDIITVKRVTERYFAELYRCCYNEFGMGFISRWYANNKILQGKDTIFKKLVEYRVYILQTQRKWLTEEIKNIDILLSNKEGRRMF